ncbi:glycoside hydrolase family 97 protein [uncultured Bacteroides sp.]|uniref:glycoside hydrolase family 97 protein n=1 Tax=uncultured Bacteroides sp. TaxID=162156 RepID=UPI002AA68DEC|nr:glycoside hydrolase family 97 protein [uncultured Bacteroides sp.]
MNKKAFFSFFFLLSAFCCMQAQKNFRLKSPDGKIVAEISVGKTITYSVSHEEDLILAPSPLSMLLTNGDVYGVNSKLTGTKTVSVDQMIHAVIYKKKEIRNHYDELTLKFRNSFSLIFRAYDDGIAYRFVSASRNPFEVKSEQAVYNFPSDRKAYVPYVNSDTQTLEEQFNNSFENTYRHINLSQWDGKRLAFLPLVVECDHGKKVAITEADLMDYPGMYLHNNDGSASLKGVFATCPAKIEQGGHNMLQGIVKLREEYIARFDKGGAFPWRILVISQNDYELANNDMVYRLASAPDKNQDYSWVKPGKVAWDWWNDWNLSHVPFKTGVNNDTYKYYIDFASSHGIEYVILDEGWAVNLKADLFQVVPEINLKELAAYAAKRNVGLILWAGYWAFNRDMESICKHYSEMGIKGFKVDFMNRDDQPMVDFHHRAAEMTAKYKMMIDFHGTYKPTGLNRTYPNVINFEGVHGLEQMKWSAPEVDQVTYDVTFPYIRMLAGPVDYTQGAMRNACKSNYRPINSDPMSQGTRCRQLAEYVVFDSPLNMMCDNPSNYMREEECTQFIAGVPTVWDRTVALNGEISHYLTIARQKGDVWYVGSLTDWNERTLNLDLSFLGQSKYEAELFKDGINADKAACDYVKETIPIPANRKLSIHMAPGGGFAMKIYPVR